MNLYALIVGIDTYPRSPLRQCVNDAKKMEAYVKSLEAHFEHIHVKPLHDAQASKEGIITGIKDFLSQAQDDDVALFYYSGHGAYERAGDRFPDEHDSMLECIVAHHRAGTDSGDFLLADKELRWLFKQELKSDAHLVTVFDCCHSGDIVREEGEYSQIKRLSRPFRQRKEYNQFIFSEELLESDLLEKSVAENFPFKNHVHLAACSSSQSSWEDLQGGVFTRYLLQLLEAESSQLSYQEIIRWARISLKHITQKEQTPVLNVQGEGQRKVDALSPWLNIPLDPNKEKRTFITKNKLSGWNLSMGSLMGIQEGQTLSVEVAGTELTGTITNVSMDSAEVGLQLKRGINLDEDRYPVSLQTLHSELCLYLNDLDNEPEERQRIEEIVSNHPHVNLSQSPGAAHFFLNVFNELVYLSRPEEVFLPLGRQINLLDDTEKLEEALKDQLATAIPWNHFHTLENRDVSFASAPIKVEVKVEGEENWQEVTESEIVVKAKKQRLEKNNSWYQKYQVRLSNVSQEKLFVGVLSLNSELGISITPFDGLVIELKPGESKLFYDHRQKPFAGVFLDSYKEIYNWKQDWVHYKFIVNNYEDFTPSLEEAKQPGLDHPLMVDIDLGGVRAKRGAITRGELAGDELDEVVQKWGTYQTTVLFNNPTYNVVSGELSTFWEEYKESEEIAPFIHQLYLDNRLEGLKEENYTPVGTEELEEGSKGININNIKMNLGNFLDDFRRKRKFNKARKRLTDRPIIVAEGDSWFLYPLLVKDIVDNVMRDFPVRSLAWAGDTLQNYKKSGQLLKKVNKLRPKYVMISGGGNDIIGPEIKDIVHENKGPGLTPEAYLNDQYAANMKELEEIYRYFIGELQTHESVKRLFIHGYDFIRVDHEKKVVENGWVNKHLEAKGIEEPSDRDRIIRYLVNEFNNMLSRIAGDNDPFVVYIDGRGKVQQGEWYDEIHPDNVGFKTIGDLFVEELWEAEKVLP